MWLLQIPKEHAVRKMTNFTLDVDVEFKQVRGCLGEIKFKGKLILFFYQQTFHFQESVLIFHQQIISVNSK